MSKVYFIKGVEVKTRILPSGDMAVWHPANERVRGVVEPICRGSGYWDPEYRNWVVKAGCLHRVEADLAAAQ